MEVSEFEAIELREVDEDDKRELIESHGHFCSFDCARAYRGGRR